jgi:superfamily II DNA or RNA helicase
MLRLVRPILYFRDPRRNLVLNTRVSFHVRLKSSSRDPSPKQKAVVEALRNSNVIVSARPGSGKTATAKAVVAANPDSPTLILTYSKRLKADTKTKLRSYRNADVHTFHS